MSVYTEGIIVLLCINAIAAMGALAYGFPGFLVWDMQGIGCRSLCSSHSYLPV